MPLVQSVVGRERLCVSGGSVEPALSIERLTASVSPKDVERFRPLLPVGYQAGANAYRQATAEITARDLAEHYGTGQVFFHERFVPQLKQTLSTLSGGHWQFDDFVAYAAGSDVDLMTHVVEAVATEDQVSLFPGDWYGFSAGATQKRNIRYEAIGKAYLACLCVPSVRNGHLTGEMYEFLANSQQCLLNLNLFPTLTLLERIEVASSLWPFADRAIFSISFSRGFGLTVSQLGVILVHRDHPMRKKYDAQWSWFTYFYNALAARAFMLIDPAELQRVDELRRRWVCDWLAQHAFPVVETGSYYVKAFHVADVPAYLRPLVRDDVLRLCFKPSQQ